MTRSRRIVITICPRERGVVRLPIERGGKRRVLDAGTIVRHLRARIAQRGLETVVTLVEACAGGCLRAGPNVAVTIYSVPPPGHPPDHVAIGWKTYVHSLGELDCLATIIDENLGTTSHGERRGRRAAPSAPRRSRRSC